MDPIDVLLIIGLAWLGYYLVSGSTDPVSDVITSIDSGTWTGGKMSASQIAAYAQAAGFTGPDLITAVAVALAESGGDPSAHGDRTLGQGSFGLWQIYSGAHPEFGPDFAALYDPSTNAAAAYQIYSRAGMSFSPWTGTYPTGLYLKFVPTVQSALAA